jgi:hypothetical protein
MCRNATRRPEIISPPKRFTERIEETVVHELAMNLDGFTGLAPMKPSCPHSRKK